MTVMPQFHVAGINTGLLALYHGAAMVIASDFAPAALLALIERHRCSQAFLVPSMIIMLLDHGGLRADHVASLRQIAYGGSAITGALLDRARATLGRSEEHTSELQSLMRISYAVFCLKKTNKNNTTN